MPADNTGDREVDRALGAVLQGAGEELTAGEGALAVAIAEAAASDADPQVGLWPDDVDLALVAQPIHVELLAAAELAPALRRVLAVEEACLADKLRKVAERHPGVLGVG